MVLLAVLWIIMGSAMGGHYWENTPSRSYGDDRGIVAFLMIFIWPIYLSKLLWKRFGKN